MKIEVGDIVNTLLHENVKVVGMDGDYYYFLDNDGDKLAAIKGDCTLVKKGEMEMEEVKFKAIEAYKLMEKGSIMKGDNGILYKVVNEKLYSKCDHSSWVGSCVMADIFFKMKFTEYKEPLKYKVGDEVWVKCEVTSVREGEERAYALKWPNTYFRENELKGIDE